MTVSFQDLLGLLSWEQIPFRALSRDSTSRGQDLGTLANPGFSHFPCSVHNAKDMQPTGLLSEQWILCHRQRVTEHLKKMRSISSFERKSTLLKKTINPNETSQLDLDVYLTLKKNIWRYNINDTGWCLISFLQLKTHTIIVINIYYCLIEQYQKI